MLCRLGWVSVSILFGSFPETKSEREWGWTENNFFRQDSMK
jgi:hypothetical protein